MPQSSPLTIDNCCALFELSVSHFISVFQFFDAIVCDSRQTDRPDHGADAASVVFVFGGGAMQISIVKPRRFGSLQLLDLLFSITDGSRVVASWRGRMVFCHRSQNFLVDHAKVRVGFVEFLTEALVHFALC